MDRWRSRASVAVLALFAGACAGRTALDDGSYVSGDGGVSFEAGPPKQKTANKLDMLFAIDNSASMGDKQELLQQAIPQLLGRLTSPWCVPSTDPTNIAVPPTSGACPTGYEFEFPAIQDIHVGIVSSSLGGGGSPDVCTAGSGDPSHQDDRGRLLNRVKAAPGGAESALATALPIDGNGGNFLAWVPASEKTNVTPEPSESQLESDFTALVGGVGESGCGLEAQLESWYRFLVQPDPYDSLTLNGASPPQAQLNGVDTTLLKMRHDFLRPDSMVVIVQITDEEDSWSDPMWLDGYGWTVRTNNFPGGPGGGAGPRGTSECDTNPDDPDCTSCAFAQDTKPVSGAPISADPNCNACAGGAPTCPQKGWYTPATPSVGYAAADGINVRYTTSMRARYGLDPQWNLQRYVDGLAQRTVPDRAHEIHDATEYASTQKNCENPLFAASLPDGSDTSAGALCNLPDGPRDPSLVYYLIIGGVPWQLLAQDPQNTALPLKRTLDASDWRRIVGASPETHQLDGIDPHMIESIAPRAGLPPPTAGDTADAINGREWNTLESASGIDLQYACIFPLAQPKDCSQTGGAACDCFGMATSADGPPICDPNDRNIQTMGKAYPTIRELRVAKGLQNQGVVASICPRSNPSSYFEVLFTRIRSEISK
ncbi:MAG TPA: hypothetical protein VGH28_23355 [Polyangiaceae bacterium]|jgi:hypothetical protein